MQIHHTKQRQAMEIGCYISATDEGRIRIFWPQRAVELFASSPDEALVEMRAAQNILHSNADYRITTKGGLLIELSDEALQQEMASPPSLPTEVLAELESNELRWVPAWRVDNVQEPPDSSRIGGIAKDGGVAYREGVPASDCPYPEESDDFSRWNDEWDEAADQTTEEEAKNGGVGSVVNGRYRAVYTEQGHPTHCGDDLAVLLNNLCQNKAGTNLELFEAICAANNINLAKYNRTSRGWQGRLRMTGRNLLAKRVVEQNGKLMMPMGFGVEFYQLDTNWVISAEVKYKPKGTGNGD